MEVDDVRASRVDGQAPRLKPLTVAAGDRQRLEVKPEIAGRDRLARERIESERRFDQAHQQSEGSDNCEHDER